MSIGLFDPKDPTGVDTHAAIKQSPHATDAYLAQFIVGFAIYRGIINNVALVVA